MIICLSGPSCAGKTTVARRLAELSHLPLRSCGEAIRAAARQANLHHADLPDSMHKEVDAATVAWALDNQPCLVEGRFVDVIFADASAPTLLFSLVAPQACRLGRAKLRDGASIGLDNLLRRDAEDAAFRARIYEAPVRRVPSRPIDTSEGEIDECAQRMLDIIEQVVPREPPRA